MTFGGASRRYMPPLAGLRVIESLAESSIAGSLPARKSVANTSTGVEACWRSGEEGAEGSEGSRNSARGVSRASWGFARSVSSSCSKSRSCTLTSVCQDATRSCMLPPGSHRGIAAPVGRTTCSFASSRTRFARKSPATAGHTRSR